MMKDKLKGAKTDARIIKKKEIQARKNMEETLLRIGKNRITVRGIIENIQKHTSI